MAQVPVIPQMVRSVGSGPRHGVVSLSPEEILHNIDEWRDAYPHLADTPLGKKYAAIREDAAQLIEEKRSQ